MKKILPTYLITIDDAYAEDGQDLGIDKIAFTSTPAIQVKGMAFSLDTPKQMIYQDSLKYRIAGPILIPMQIYRNDDSEYYVQFTVDGIEKIHKKYMSKPNKELFNLEHTDEQVPAYAMEVMLVDSQIKQDMIKQEYNIDIPLGSSFMVAQVTDKDYYNQLVANDQIGFSIEGFLGLKMSDLLNNNKQIKQNEMIKQEFKLQDGSTLQLFEDGSTHIVLADLPVEEDKVIEDIKEDAKDEEMADELPVDVPVEAPAVDTYTKSEIDAKFDELYSLIADIKAKDEVEDVVEEAVPVAMSLQDRFSAFVRFANQS